VVFDAQQNVTVPPGTAKWQHCGSVGTQVTNPPQSDCACADVGATMLFTSGPAAATAPDLPARNVIGGCVELSGRFGVQTVRLVPPGVVDERLALESLDYQLPVHGRRVVVAGCPGQSRGSRDPNRHGSGRVGSDG
jgi:hypothetical protein